MKNEIDPTKADILIVEEVCQILRISKSKIYDMVQSGEIAHVNFNGCIRFRRYDINQYIERCVISR